MTYITYKDMVLRFGAISANGLLRTIERLAQIQHEIVVPFDHEERLHQALMALNDNGPNAHAADSALSPLTLF